MMPGQSFNLIFCIEKIISGGIPIDRNLRKLKSELAELLAELAESCVEPVKSTYDCGDRLSS